jgi:hypothetical protein
MKLTEPIIQFIGLNELTPEEKHTVMVLSTEYQDKIQIEMQKPTSIAVHIKLFYGKENQKRKKFGIHIKTLAAGKIYEEKTAADWDLARTLHEAFNSLERLILHSKHKDSQRKPAHRRKRE